MPPPRRARSLCGQPPPPAPAAALPCACAWLVKPLRDPAVTEGRGASPVHRCVLTAAARPAVSRQSGSVEGGTSPLCRTSLICPVSSGGFPAFSVALTPGYTGQVSPRCGLSLPSCPSLPGPRCSPTSRHDMSVLILLHSPGCTETGPRPIRARPS